VVLDQDNRRPLVLRQAFDRLLDELVRLAEFGLCQRQPGVGGHALHDARAVGVRARGLVERHGPAKLALLELVDAQVRRDPVQPRRELGERLVARGVPVYAEEGLLADVLRGLAIAQEGVAEGHHGVTVAVKQDFKSILAAARHAPHQRFIRLLPQQSAAAWPVFFHSCRSERSLRHAPARRPQPPPDRDRW